MECTSKNQKRAEGFDAPSQQAVARKRHVYNCGDRHAGALRNAARDPQQRDRIVQN